MTKSVEAVVAMSPSKDGGLELPLSLPCQSLFVRFGQESETVLVGVLIQGLGLLEPGTARTVRLHAIYPESVPLFYSARAFELWYGRIVGYGTIAV